MGPKLEKDEYLRKFDEILKKYGYTEMYCWGGFRGKKERGLVFQIHAPLNSAAMWDFIELVDPTLDAEYADPEGLSCVMIDEYRSYDFLEVVYKDGEFYANS